MFETEADYRARVSKQTDLVQYLQAELTAKEQQIKNMAIARILEDGEIIELKDGSQWTIAIVYRFQTKKWRMYMKE